MSGIEGVESYNLSLRRVRAELVAIREQKLRGELNWPNKPSMEQVFEYMDRCRDGIGPRLRYVPPIREG